MPLPIENHDRVIVSVSGDETNRSPLRRGSPMTAQGRAKRRPG